MNGLFILLGSNLGDRLANLQRAKNLLIESGFTFLNQSSVYETEPWGVADQPWFLNAVVQFEVTCSPEDALATCLSIEEAMGRKRALKWGERLIDIDILFFNEQIVETETLSIPHPGIPDRRFALLPMAEKWPEEIHPVLNQNTSELLVKSTDTLKCTITDLKF